MGRRDIFTAAWLLAACACAAAHVHVSEQRYLRHSVMPRHSEENLIDAAFPQVTVENPKLSSSTCQIFMGVLLFLCCCGSATVNALAKVHPALVGLPTIINIGVIGYLATSGSFSQLVAGKLDGICWWLCVLALIQLVFLAIGTCLVCMALTASVALAPMAKEAIKNQAIQEIRAEFDKLEQELPEDQRAYYTSAEFKILCDDMFHAADTDQSGSLDMAELRKPLLEKYGSHLEEDENFVLAFDKNKNSFVELGEFREMIKYFELKKARKDEAEL